MMEQDRKCAYSGGIQTVFERYELKYLLTAAQKEEVLSKIKPYMQPDKYGRTTIRNLYYDTDNYLLIRRSIEKPAYKEKLRVRSYSRAEQDSGVFVELKKKCSGIVNKRRVPLQNQEAIKWLSGEKHPPKYTQIVDEIDYFLAFYGTLQPKVFLSYEREAYYGKDSADLRVTFDENILCRQNDLSLASDVYGTEILPEGKVLMEIKCSGGIPLWIVEILSKEKIYKTAFSKYGTAYKALIFPQTHNVNIYNALEVMTNV